MGANVALCSSLYLHLLAYLPTTTPCVLALPSALSLPPSLPSRPMREIAETGATTVAAGSAVVNFAAIVNTVGKAGVVAAGKNLSGGGGALAW